MTVRAGTIGPGFVVSLHTAGQRESGVRPLTTADLDDVVRAIGKVVDGYGIG